MSKTATFIAIFFLATLPGMGTALVLSRQVDTLSRDRAENVCERGNIARAIDITDPGNGWRAFRVYLFRYGAVFFDCNKTAIDHGVPHPLPARIQKAYADLACRTAIEKQSQSATSPTCDPNKGTFIPIIPDPQPPHKIPRP